MSWPHFTLQCKVGKSFYFTLTLAVLFWCESRLSCQLDSLATTINTLRRTQFSAQPNKCIFAPECKNFVVGRIYSSTSSRVHFFGDRVEYNVQHPTQGKIHMVMFFRDMTHTKTHIRKRTFQFKIDKPLLLFGSAYNPTDFLDILKMEFITTNEYQQFQHAFPGFL